MATVDSLEIQIEGSARKANDAIESLISNLGRLTTSLEIDTSGLEKIGKSLNFSGAEKSIKTAENKMKILSKSAAEVARDVQNKFKDISVSVDFSKPEAELQKFKKQAREAENTLSRITASSFAEKQARSIEKYSILLAQANKAISILEKHISEMPEADIDVNTKDIEKADNFVEILKEQIKKEIEGIQVENPIRMTSLSDEGFSLYKRLRAEMEETAAKAKEVGQQIEESVQTPESASGFGGPAIPFEEYMNSASEKAKEFKKQLSQLAVPEIRTEGLDKLRSELEKAEADLEKLRTKLENEVTMGRMSETVDDAGFRKLQEQIALTEKTAEALREKINQVQKTSSQTSGGAKNLGDSIKTASNSFSSLANSSSRAIKPLNSLGSSFKSLMRTILPILGIRQLFNWGKQAVEVSSDLTEVQNVVDTTFGNMSYKLEEFADTSIEKFGMSELSLKQYSSRFQAMGTAMGFPAEKMSDMSIELTKLTADMASFYNVEQDVVAEKLSSVFTGQTRPLRDFGLDLTQATLQEWALKQGIDADIQSMSQAEKTMLRYKYVLENTTAAQGDFSKTANTWANQIRILSQQFQQFGSIVGKGVISAFKPFIQTLNNVMKKVIAFSENVLNALGKIFGWKIEITGGGLTNDLDDAAGYTDDIASGAGDASDGYKDAAKNAKKLKDVVLGIDELNINAPDDGTENAGGSSGSPSGGAGGIGADVGTGLATNMFSADTIFEEYESSIDSLYKLGKYIGDTLTKAMNSIRWTDVYESARNFGTGLADFLNGLISPELFGATGRTIAGALNTAIYAALSFGETFDFREFGFSIAAGVNNFFSAFDFPALAQTINTWVSGIFETILAAIDKTNWELIGEKIGDFISEIDILKAIGKFGETVWKAINAAIKTYASTFSKAPVETALLSLAVIPKVLKTIVDTKFAKGIVNLSNKFKNFAGATRLAAMAFNGNTEAVVTLAANFPKLSKSVDVARVAFANLKLGVVTGNVFGGIWYGIKSVIDSLGPLAKGLIGVTSVFAEFSLIKGAFYDIASGSENLVAALAKIAAGAGVAVAALKMIGLSNPFTAVITGATALISAFVGINQAMDNITKNSMFETLEAKGGVSLKSLGDVALNTFGVITNGVDATIEKLNNIESTKESINSTIESIGGIQRAIDNGAYSASEKVPQIIEQFQGLLNDSKTVLEEEYDVIVQNLVGAWADVLTAQGKSVPEYVRGLLDMKNQGNEALSELEGSFNSLAKQYEEGKISAEEFDAQLTPLIETIRRVYGDKIADSAAAAVQNLGDALNMSQYMGENGFAVESFQADLEAVTQSAQDARDNLENLALENSNTLTGFQTDLEGLGVYAASYDWSSLYGANDAQVSQGISDINAAYESYANQLQYNLLEQMPSVVEDATKDYDKLQPWQKLFVTKEDYVQKEIDAWTSNILNPASESIQSAFDQLGIEGEPWAGEAAKALTDSMFDSFTTNSFNGVQKTTTSLRTNWEDILKNALDGASKAVNAENYGKDTVDGVNNGISKNAESTRKSIWDWIGSIPDWIHDEPSMGFGSPSKTAMGFGKDTVDGYNLGIENNSSSTQSVIGTMMNSVIGRMTEGLAPIKTSLPQMMSSVWTGIKNVFAPTREFFSTTFTNAYNSIKTAFSFIGTWFLEKWNEIKDAFRDVVQFFQQKFTDAYNAIKSAFSFISNWFQDKWNAVKNVFRDAISFFREKFSGAYNAVKSAFSSINTWFQGKWDDVKKVFGNVKSFFEDGFRKAYNAVTRIWDGIGGYFKEIANKIIGPIGKAVNGVINGINWVLEKVGSGTRLNTWQVPAFAKGDNGLPRDTIGIVNDQAGAVYKELIVPPRGKPFIPNGRNVVLPMEKGTKIMPAKQTKELMSKMPHFAGGIGDFLSGAWEAIKGFTGNVMDYLTNPGDIAKIALDKFIDVSEWFGIYGSIASGAVTKVFDEVVSYIKKIFSTIVPQVSYNPSAGVEQWRKLASYALKLTGQFSEQNLKLLLFQMQTESGGNPNAINNWDINAQMGIPSKGLMQVIDPTFRAYAMPGYDKNVYDPLSNILAAIRYTLARYGSLANGWRGHGYATGIGEIKASDLFPKYSVGGFPEDGLFMANHSELIGKFSNGKTAVANNDQIERGIEEATYRGYMRAHMDGGETTLLEEIRDAIREGKSISIDGREIVRAYDSRKARMGYPLKAY